MPPRREPGPDQPDALAVLELIAAGSTVPEAARECGLQPSTVWNWIDAGQKEEPPLYFMDRPGRKNSRMSVVLWRACQKFSLAYQEAKLEQRRSIAQAALKTIRTAAEKGFARAKVKRKLVAGVVTEETHESEQGAPVWQAAAWYLERTHPDEYGLKTRVEVSGDFRLEPGEADAIAAACTDEEAKAIDHGDVKVLAQVRARVRAEKKSKPTE